MIFSLAEPMPLAVSSVSTSLAGVTITAGSDRTTVGHVGRHELLKLNGRFLHTRSGNCWYEISSKSFNNRWLSKGALVVRAAESATPTKPKPRYPGENKGFVEEMRFVAMKLHTKDQAKEGEKQATDQPVAKWEPSLEGFIKFLVNSKVVFDCVEEIVGSSSHPSYAEFRNTGLERSSALAKDLQWLENQGHTIPGPSEEGNSYADLLKKLSETDQPGFICHYYNIYFAHSAGGRFIGKKVCEAVLDGKELEFYKWDGDLPTLLGSVKEKLNKVAEDWTREEKNHCLEETKLSFQYSGGILRLIIS